MALTLYLMRHGIAEDHSPSGTDADRALTAEGVRKTSRGAAGLRTLGVAPDLILTSPLRRAEETARLVGEALDAGDRITLAPLLAGGYAPEDVLTGLAVPRRAAQVMLVGHQPDLGLLASYLMTGTATLAPLPFRKAAVAAFSLDGFPPRTPAELQWFLTPAQLRALGGDTR